MDHRETVRAAGLEQALYTGNDLVVDLVAGKGVARTRPGVGQIDVDQCGLLAEADAALKAAILVQFSGLFKGLFEICHQVIGHLCTPVFVV
ncbi:hypothetical protein D3C84_327560 [compost metagenome]